MAIGAATQLKDKMSLKCPARVATPTGKRQQQQEQGVRLSVCVDVCVCVCVCDRKLVSCFVSSWRVVVSSM